MNQDNFNLDNCKYCGNKIDPELITKINERNSDVICQYCAYPLFINTNYNEKLKMENQSLMNNNNEDHHGEITDDLKEIYKFKIYQNNRANFGFYITIFAGRFIYNNIKKVGSDLEITDQITEMIANTVITEFIDHKIEKEWLNEFKSIKKNFKRTYKKFQSELKSDQTFREDCLGFFRLLVKVVCKLINKIDSELQDIEYDIAEDIIKRDLFETNRKFTEPFRYNLKICLSRLIFLRIKDIASKNKLKICQLILTEIEKRYIALDFLKYLISHNEIIIKFLGKLEGIEIHNFNVYYEQLCLELNSDSLFAESFNFYLRGVIGNIHDIICGKYKWRELSNLYRIIITKLEQLLNVEVDFQSLSHNDDLNPHQGSELLENNQNLITEHNIESNNESFIRRKKQSKDITKNIYSTLEFVQDLKKEVTAILSKYISNEKLGEILGQKKSHIKSILEYARKDPNYLLTLDLITIWEKQLKSKITYSKKLKSIIKNYKDTNKLLQKRQWVLYHHPDLDLDYFKVINTKEKAYWFGWLFAEGSLYIIESKSKESSVISVEISVSDGILIKQFVKAIGFNPKFVEYRKRIIVNNDTNKKSILRSFRVRFANRIFGENMCNNGFVLGKKSDKFKFPKLKNRELDLAFLLGFFDGDGKQGETRIKIRSRLFLENIKSKFNLKNKIGSEKYKIKNGEEREVFRLHLGADLFNEMLDNYQNSLERKRIRFFGSELRNRLTAERMRAKFKFSKEELEKLVRKLSQIKIAQLHKELYGIPIGPGTVSKWCKKWNIKCEKKKES